MHILNSNFLPRALRVFTFCFLCLGALLGLPHASAALIIVPPLNVTNPAVMSICTTVNQAYTIKNGSAGANYTWSFSTTASPDPFTFTVSGTRKEKFTLYGSLKTVLPGTYTATINVTESPSGATASITRTIKVINDSISWRADSPINLSRAIQGVNYVAKVGIQGGRPPYRYSLTSGSLPVTLTLNSTTGEIKGMPTDVCSSFSFTVSANDTCSGMTINRTFTLPIACPVTVNGTSTINATMCTPKTPECYTASGGTPPYTWSPTRPVAGLIITVSGTGNNTLCISGTPNLPGNHTITLIATDSSSPKKLSASKKVTIKIPKTATLAWPTCSSLPDGLKDTAYSATLSACFASVTGGMAPYTFTIKSGSLPTGCNLDLITGDITGTPTTAGTFNFTIQATDACGNKVTKLFTVEIKDSSISCGNTADSGGEGVTIKNVVVPTAAGNINFDYDAYTIPDAFKAEANGVVYVDTGSISRAGTASFCKPAGVTSVIVTVTGPSGTAWEFTLGCPSGACSPAVPSISTVSVVAAECMQSCIVNAISVLPNVSINDIAKTDHLDTAPFIIGKTEVTNEEYCVFLNAVAKKSDIRGLYNSAMGTSPNGGIFRSGKVGAYSYAVKSGMSNYPVVYVSWFDAARYVNWLSNGSPTGLQDKTTTEDGAYALNGATSGVSIVRNAINPNTKNQPTKSLLNESEWFTSAYLKPSKLTAVSFWNYPTQSDTAPDITLANPNNLANYGNIFTGPTEVGFFSESLGTFGTLDQGGNVREWTESADSGKYRVIRGGSWADSANSMLASESDIADPVLEDDKTGFRIGGAP